MLHGMTNDQVRYERCRGCATHSACIDDTEGTLCACSFGTHAPSRDGRFTAEETSGSASPEAERHTLARYISWLGVSEGEPCTATIGFSFCCK